MRVKMIVKEIAQIQQGAFDLGALVASVDPELPRHVPPETFSFQVLESGGKIFLILGVAYPEG